MVNLRELYVAELEDLYSAEKQLVEALPKLASYATNLELKMAFETHLEETKRHVERLDHVFDTLEARPCPRHCTVMEQLIGKTQDLVAEKTGDVLDAVLIARAQHIEHFEIAGYGTLKTYAIILGEVGHLRLFQQTLHEEAVVDDWLTEIAHEAIDIDATIGARAKQQLSDREVAQRTEFDRPPLREEPRGIPSPSWNAITETRDR